MVLLCFLIINVSYNNLGLTADSPVTRIWIVSLEDGPMNLLLTGFPGGSDAGGGWSPF